MRREQVERLMKRCQAGSPSADGANNLLAECYGTLGALLIEREQLARHAEALINCADPGRDLNEIRAARAHIREMQ
jgi:hypothetical protein